MPTPYSGSDTYPATANIPSDGDGPPQVADVNPAFEALFDRTTALRNVSFRRVSQWTYDDDTFAGGVPVWVFNSATFAANTTDANAWVVDVTNVRVDDIISIEASFVVVAPIDTDCFVRLGVTHNALGGGSQVLAPGFRILAGDSGGIVQQPYSLSTHVTATAAGTSRIRLVGRGAGAGTLFSVQGYGEIRATLNRPSGSAA